MQQVRASPMLDKALGGRVGLTDWGMSPAEAGWPFCPCGASALQEAPQHRECRIVGRGDARSLAGLQAERTNHVRQPGADPRRIDPADPFYGNRDGPGQVTPHIGNTKAPVLKPWAARQMQDANDDVLNSKRGPYRI